MSGSDDIRIRLLHAFEQLLACCDDEAQARKFLMAHPELASPDAYPVLAGTYLVASPAERARISFCLGLIRATREATAFPANDLSSHSAEARHRTLGPASEQLPPRPTIPPIAGLASQPLDLAAADEAAGELLEQYRQSGDDRKLLLAISLLEARVDRLGPAPWDLSRLGSAFVHLFERFGDKESLDYGVALQVRASQEEVDDAQVRSLIRVNLANSKARRYQYGRDPQELDEAISLWEEVIGDGEAPSWSKQGALANVGNGFSMRFRLKGDRHDLLRSIDAHRAALKGAQAEGAMYPTVLHNLAISLADMYHATGTLIYLEEAVSLEKRSVRLTDDSAPDMPTRLAGLATLLTELARWHQSISGLTEAIALEEIAISRTPNTAPYLSDIFADAADTQMVAYAISRDEKHLDKALEFSALAESAVPRTAHFNARSLKVSSAWMASAESSAGSLALVDGAIEVMRAASARLVGKPSYSDNLIDLANLLRERFEFDGDIEGLEELVALYETALREANPTDRSRALAALGTGLGARASETNNVDDFQRAADLLAEVANDAATDRRVRCTALANLGLLHRWRASSRRGGGSARVDELDSAIEWLRRALEMADPTGIDEIKFLLGLADALLARYNEGNDTKDVTEACRHCESAVRALPPGSPLRPYALLRLSRVLLQDPDRIGLGPAASAAADRCREGLDDAPPDTALRGELQGVLGEALLVVATGNGRVEALRDAVAALRARWHYLRKTFTSGILPYRLRVQGSWATQGHELACALIGLARHTGDGDLLWEALEVLESSRAQVLGDILVARRLDDASLGTDREAAKAATDMRATIISMDVESLTRGSQTDTPSRVDAIRARRRAAAGVAGSSPTVREHIRAVLNARGRDTAIVSIDVGRQGTVVITSQPDEPYPRATIVPVARDAWSSTVFGSLVPDVRWNRQGNDDAILWTEALGPVADAVLDTVRPGSRLVLSCPAIALFVPWPALLLLSRRRRKEVRGLVVTPSVWYVDSNAPGWRPGRLRVVVMGDAEQGDALAALPHAQQEAITVAQIWGVDPLIGQRATRATFLAALQREDLVHCAIHGALDFDDPLGGSITFSDGKVRTRDLLATRVSASLVILSACDSGFPHLLDATEPVSLGQALLLAGARAVVTTLWPVDDRAACHLAEAFHNRVKAGAALDIALADSQREMQRTPGWEDPYYWAGFVLAGDRFG